MILVLDIGKTNKKCFVFDADYHLVFERSATLPETVDEDGEPCEDLTALRHWLLETVRFLLREPRFSIRAVNVTAYGASLVHLDAAGRPVTPLCNYLKPFPDDLLRRFLATYGDEATLGLQTASPVLGSLNSGLQLYRLKVEKPLVFNQINCSLHLPQYLAALIRAAGLDEAVPGLAASEITSIGCHTLLWDFQKNDYHDWVKAEGLAGKFPAIKPSGEARPLSGNIQSGGGLHDSSAALIPYLAAFGEPFVLLSTGTWCISLNPFDRRALTAEDLANDGLCYLTYAGKPVKAARFFGGNEHEKEAADLARAFGKPVDYYQTVAFDPALLARARRREARPSGDHPFPDYETAYHAFMIRLLQRQYVSTKRVVTTATRRLFVDGGFSKNEIFMRLLATFFPEIEVCAAEVAQATALGAALVLHPVWNRQPLPGHLISLKKYTPVPL